MHNLEIPSESGSDNAYILVKGAIGAIPIIGSIAAETFGLILSAPITKRREKWMEAIVNKLKELETTSKNFKIEELKDNEEFISFVLECSQIAFKTHQDEKLVTLKNSVGNFLLTTDIEYDKKYSFLKIIEVISPTHLKILFFLSENQKFILDNIKGYKQLFEKFQEIDTLVDKFYFRKCIRDIENQSLIRVSKDFADFEGGGGFATDEGAASIKILDYGQEFIKFITKQE